MQPGHSLRYHLKSCGLLASTHFRFSSVEQETELHDSGTKIKIKGNAQGKRSDCDTAHVCITGGPYIKWWLGLPHTAEVAQKRWLKGSGKWKRCRPHGCSCCRRKSRRWSRAAGMASPLLSTHQLFCPFTYFSFFFTFCFRFFTATMAGDLCGKCAGKLGMGCEHIKKNRFRP